MVPSSDLFVVFSAVSFSENDDTYTAASGNRKKLRGWDVDKDNDYIYGSDDRSTPAGEGRQIKGLVGFASRFGTYSFTVAGSGGASEARPESDGRGLHFC